MQCTGFFIYLGKTISQTIEKERTEAIDTTDIVRSGDSEKE